MEYKNFKKIKDDKEYAMLLHPMGHEIKVAKKGLSKKSLKDLDCLPIHAADGVMVEDPNQIPTDTNASISGAPGNQMLQPMNAPQATPSAGMGIQQAAPLPDTKNEAQEMEKEFFDEQMKHDQDRDSGLITPKHYFSLFDRESTVGKIGTIFGLMLSGVGSGLTGQPNLLLQKMNKEIENDLQAQERSAANRQNYLRINLESNLNEAKIKNMVQEGKLTHEQADELRMKNKFLSKALSQANMYSDTVHHLENQIKSIPPNSPLRPKAEMLINGIKQEAAKKVAEVGKNAVQQAASVKSSVPWYMRPGSALTEMIEEKLGHPIAANAAETPPMEKKEEGTEDVNELPNKILSPNAKSQFATLAFRPDAAPFLGEITKQYSSAQQAERLLGSVDDVVDKMVSAAKAGGESDYRRRQLSPQDLGNILSVAGGGSMVGNVAGALGKARDAWSTMSEENKQYFVNQARLLNEIRSLLPGVASEEVMSVMRNYAPEYNDSKRTLAMKRNAIKNFIHMKVDRSLLKQFNMVD